MAVSKVELDLECPVCHDDYTEPKFLPCTHVVCCKCVVSWLAVNMQGGCPLCRAPILHFPPGQDVSDSVNSLPTDLATMALVDSKNALSDSHVCSVCDQTPSTSYCLDCGIKLCKSCTTAHGRFPSFREHVLEELSCLTPERLASSRRYPCDSHPDKLAELYCPYHQTLICLLCSSSVHRTCSDVKTISDMAKEARVTLMEQAVRLRNTEAALLAQIRQVDQEIHGTQAQFNAWQTDVADTCDSLQHTIEKLRKEMNAQLQKEQDNILAPKRARKTLLEQQKTSVQAHAGSVERLLIPSPDSALLGMLDKLKARLDDLERSPPLPGEKSGVGPAKSSFSATLIQLQRAQQLINDPSASSSVNTELNAEPVYHTAVCQEIHVYHNTGILCYDSSCRTVPVGQFVGQRPLGPGCNKFSIEIINEGRSRCISVGLCPLPYPPNQQPGWAQGSIGYHADDGGIFLGQGSPSTTRKPAYRRDVMSVEFDFREQRAMFFCNGDQVFRTSKLRVPASGFYPIVGMHSEGEVVQLQSKDPWQPKDESTVYHSSQCREVHIWHDTGVLCYDSKSRSVPVGQFIGQKPLSRECNKFSLEIIYGGQSCCIAIGLCPRRYRPNRQPGWDEDSVGYHADDGGIFLGSGHWSTRRKQAGRGDVMSVELDFNDVAAIFRHNNDVVYKTSRLEIPAGGFYPMVGLHSQGEVVRLLEREPWQPQNQ